MYFIEIDRYNINRYLRYKYYSVDIISKNVYSRTFLLAKKLYDHL